MKYEDVVVMENTHKCYNIIYKHDGVEYDIIAQVYYEGDYNIVHMYLYDDGVMSENLEIGYYEPLSKDCVIEIKGEVTHEGGGDGFVDDEDDYSEEYPDPFSEMDFEAIKHLETKCPSVYSCKSVEDLELLYKSLNEPIINDVDYDMEINRDFFESVLLNATSGSVLVYYYSEYDDFSCYGDGFTHMIKIINV